MATEFPEVETKHGITTTIYERKYEKTAKDGSKKQHVEYMLVYYSGEKRKRETSANLLTMRTRASEVRGDLQQGRAESVSLTGNERDAYALAKQYIAPTGVRLDVAANHFAQAVKILGGDLVIEAAREYVKRNLVNIEPKTVPEVVKEFIETRERQSRSDRHLDTLRSHCDRFGAAMQKNISTVRAEEIEIWLDSLTVQGREKNAGQKISARTRDNILGSLNNLFEFAKSKKWLPKDHDELENVTRLDNDEDGPIEIYTPEEIKLLLQHADKQLVPFIAIGAWAGLRASEIERLEWSDVRFDSDCIIVQKGKVKKRGKSRRMAPLLPNLKKLLKPFAKNSGKVWPHCHAYIYELMREAVASAKITLKENALRHAFISYRVATVKNVPQVALESGNSPQIIDSNYRELVTDKDAAAWFSVVRIPKKPKASTAQSKAA